MRQFTKQSYSITTKPAQNFFIPSNFLPTNPNNLSIVPLYLCTIILRVQDCDPEEVLILHSAAFRYDWW